MTTRRAAENLLFNAVYTAIKANAKPSLPEIRTASPRPIRRRIGPYSCDLCDGWADVLLQPLRLRCARCGHEKTP